MTSVLPLQQKNYWTDGLTLNNRGVPVGNLLNVVHALGNAPDWQGVLAYDEFAARVITTRPPPWGGPTINQWTDHHDTRACVWFQEHGIPVSPGVVGRGILTAARESPVHPVRDYLSRLTWDRTPRLDTWLTTHLGVEDSRYVQAVGSRFLISAIARVFRPGCQADCMLILEGAQGTLKSSALRALAHPWFTDRISKPGGKDASMEVKGIWLVEMSELDALTRATNSATKSFITCPQDRFRAPYGRHVVDQPRQCVFAGTINPQGGYLKDPTGARRFWPVSCGVIDLDGLRRDRDQLWAEALVRYQAGAAWWLETPELEALATAEQATRFEVDAWTEVVDNWLVSRDDVSVGEVLMGALGISRESWSQTAQNRIAKILKIEGFEKFRPGRAGRSRTPRYRRVGAGQGASRQIRFNKKSDGRP
jgi:predicted P-loop ATPase